MRVFSGATANGSSSGGSGGSGDSSGSSGDESSSGSSSSDEDAEDAEEEEEEAGTETEQPPQPQPPAADRCRRPSEDQLPRLTPQLAALIADIKAAAELAGRTGEGKMKFFSPEVNKMLLK